MKGTGVFERTVSVDGINVTVRGNITLIRAAESATPIAQAGGNFTKTVAAALTIGTDVTTGQATSLYTVVTNQSGELVTAFPGV